MNGSAITAIGLAVILAVVGVYDVYAGVRWGNDATVSRLVAYVSSKWPVVPLLVGIILGHLFWPQVPVSQVPPPITSPVTSVARYTGGGR